MGTLKDGSPKASRREVSSSPNQDSKALTAQASKVSIMERTKKLAFSTEPTLVGLSQVETWLPIAQDPAESGIEYGGLILHHLRLALVAASGEEFPMPDTESQEGLHKDHMPKVPVLTSVKTAIRCAYVGDTKLLMIIPAKVYIFDNDCAIGSNLENSVLSPYLHPYTDIVRIVGAETLSLGTLLPSLANSQWDAVRLVDPKFGYVASVSQGIRASFGGTRKGLWFETKLVFTGALEPVSRFMEDFFGQKDPGIDFSAWLSRERRFDSLASLNGIVLRGALRNMSWKLFGIVEFREMGVELSAAKRFDMTKHKMVWDTDWSFYGNLNLSFPGLKAGLEVDYQLRSSMETWQLALRLSSEDWKNAFGLEWLTLREVVMVCDLDRSNPKETSVAFSLMATMSLREAALQIRGSISKDHWELSVFIGNLSFKDIGEILHEITGYDLEVFDHDVTFEAMSLHISSKRIALMGAVTINGRTSAQGTLILEKDGIQVSGSVGDLILDDWDLTITKAGFDVFMASKMKGPNARTTRFSIFGNVDYHGIKSDVALHIKKNDKGNLMWTVYGEVNGKLTISRFFPELKGNAFDMGLERLAIIASSEDARAGELQGVPYDVLKGVQLCAGLGRIEALDTLLGGSAEGLTLRTAYSQGNFSVELVLPATRTIRFNDRASSGPLALGFFLEKGTPALKISSSVFFKVDGQKEDLELKFTLAAKLTEASTSARLKTPWHNPFNIGKDVVIQSAALEIAITYSTFLNSGPSKFAFEGHICVGTKEVLLQMVFSQNPKEQLLHGKQTDLSAQDLVEFASLVAQRNLPAVEKGLLHIHEFDFYLSTGASLAGEYFEPGARIKGDMTLFGKRAQFDCSFGELIKIFATVEQFSIGPLLVRGATKRDPEVNIKFSADEQRILIDGAVDFWDSTALLYVKIEILPQTKFHFWFYLQLSDIFRLKLNADLEGQVDIKNYKTWAAADFVVSGLMEQEALTYIAAQLEDLLETVKQADKVSFQKLMDKMTDEEEKFKKACANASSQVEATHVIWAAKQKEVNSQVESAKRNAKDLCNSLRLALDQARLELDRFISQTETQIEKDKNTAAARRQLAKTLTDAAQTQLDQAVAAAQAVANRKKAAFDTMVTDRATKVAQQKSKKEEQEQFLRNCKYTLEMERRQKSDAAFGFGWTHDLAIRATEELVNQAQSNLEILQTAYLLAAAAELTPDYIACQKAVLDAEAEVVAVRLKYGSALRTAETALSAEEVAEKTLYETSKILIKKARETSEESLAFEHAKGLLADAERQLLQVTDQGQAQLKALATSIEATAYNTATETLAYVSENTQKLNLARSALEYGREQFATGLELASWAIKHVEKTFNIREIRFHGSVKALVNPSGGGGTPLYVKVRGTVLGEEIDWEMIWKPKFDLVQFIKELFAKLWKQLEDMLKQAQKELTSF